MAGARSLISSTLGAVARRLPLFRRPPAAFRLLLPFYHAVSDAPVPHISPLYPVKGVKAFEADLDFLLQHYEPISYADFHALTTGDSPLRKPAMLLSFDDGLREFHDPIAPLLLRKGVPAICFLNSAFIDNAALFFRYKAALLIHYFESQPAKPMPAAVLALTAGQPLRNWALSRGYAQRHELDEAAAAVGLDFDLFLSTQQPYLTAAQIRSLQEQGFDFGAHSVDHPEYRLLPLAQQLQQTRDSLHAVAEQFGEARRIFSFPFTDHGVGAGFFFQLKAEGCAAHTFGCAGQKTESIPTHHQRLAMEQGTFTARDILRTELLFHRLRAPFGKNHIHRA